MTAGARRTKTKRSPADPLWTAYFRSRSVANRNALVERYLPLVNRAAHHLHSRLPNSVAIDDLIQTGTLGLISAVAGFDRKRNVSFDTYCQLRIRGAMIDQLREMDWVPRLVRVRAEKIANATRELESEGIEVTDRTLSRRLRIKMSALQSWFGEIAVPAVGGLESIVPYAHVWEEGKQPRIEDVLRDEDAPPPDADVSADSWWNVALRGLSEMARVAITLYYRHNWIMQVVGLHMGVSESRISQLIADSLTFLRSYRSVGDFADITNGARVKGLLPLLAFCHRERRRQLSKPTRQLTPQAVVKRP